MPRILLTNVTKQWGKFIGVNDLNLEIEDGSFVRSSAPPAAEKPQPFG